MSSFAFTAASTPAVLGDPFVAIVYPGASTFPRDGTLTGIGKDFSDSNVCLGIGYADPEATDEEMTEKMVLDLEEYEFLVDEIIGYRSYKYPSVPRPSAVADDWFAKMTALQGTNNIYVVGEALSGYGVPTALNFIADFISKYFTD